MNRVRRRHCGDHVEWETVSVDKGRNRPYLFALFLTILTDCSVKCQTSNPKNPNVLSETEGGGTVRLTCRGGLSKLAHTKTLREWMGAVVL